MRAYLRSGPVLAFIALWGVVIGFAIGPRGPQVGPATEDFYCSVTSQGDTTLVRWRDLGARGYDVFSYGPSASSDDPSPTWVRTNSYEHETSADDSPIDVYKIVAWGNGQDNKTTTCQDSRVARSAVIVAAGDLGGCDSEYGAAVGNYVENRTDAEFLALGDLAYPEGSPENFTQCYDPQFGGAKDRTLPVVGNHERDTDEAAGYVGYFGDRIGATDEMWYSKQLSGWHVVVLNSGCSHIGGCDVGSPQYEWLQTELTEKQPECLLAAWHHAYFSSAIGHSTPTDMTPVFELLEAHGADVLVAADAHNYERFDKLTSDRTPSADGIRSFVVGTGGASQIGFDSPEPGSVIRQTKVWGTLELILGPNWYRWEFINLAGEDFTDQGQGACSTP